MDAGLDLVTGFPPVLALEETFGSPRFLGSPCANVPRSLTPVSCRALAETDKTVLPSDFSTSSAITKSGLSRLNHAAHWFAVYA